MYVNVEHGDANIMDEESLTTSRDREEMISSHSEYSDFQGIKL